jgi:hypothetical protein
MVELQNLAQHLGKITEQIRQIPMRSNGFSNFQQGIVLTPYRIELLSLKLLLIHNRKNALALLKVHDNQA